MTAGKGRYIHKIQEIAAFASMLLPEAERNELRARHATAHEVRARFEMHHIAYHTWTENNMWWNLDPMLKAEHREHTRGDIATIAKSKRIVKKQLAHLLKLVDNTKTDGHGHVIPPRYKRHIPSRPFPKGRKMRGKK